MGLDLHNLRPFPSSCVVVAWVRFLTGRQADYGYMNGLCGLTPCWVLLLASLPQIWSHFLKGHQPLMTLKTQFVLYMSLVLETALRWAEDEQHTPQIWVEMTRLGDGLCCRSASRWPAKEGIVLVAGLGG